MKTPAWERHLGPAFGAGVLAGAVTGSVDVTLVVFAVVWWWDLVGQGVVRLAWWSTRFPRLSRPLMRWTPAPFRTWYGLLVVGRALQDAYRLGAVPSTPVRLALVDVGEARRHLAAERVKKRGEAHRN